jgi:hypothetical protein
MRGRVQYVKPLLVEGVYYIYRYNNIKNSGKAVEAFGFSQSIESLDQKWGFGFGWCHGHHASSSGFAAW